jgi:hypothetical protein
VPVLNFNLIFPKASVLLKELVQAVPAGVAKLIAAKLTADGDELAATTPADEEATSVPPPQEVRNADSTAISVQLRRLLNIRSFIEINIIFSSYPFTPINPKNYKIYPPLHFDTKH